MPIVLEAWLEPQDSSLCYTIICKHILITFWSKFSVLHLGKRLIRVREPGMAYEYHPQEIAWNDPTHLKQSVAAECGNLQVIHTN